MLSRGNLGIRVICGDRGKISEHNHQFNFQLVFVRYAGIAMSDSPALLEHIAYVAATIYTNTEITPK